MGWCKPWTVARRNWVTDEITEIDTQMNSHNPQQMALALAELAMYTAPTTRVNKTRSDEVVEPVRRRSGPVVGRNEPCPCGSGKKFKKCCRS